MGFSALLLAWAAQAAAVEVAANVDRTQLRAGEPLSLSVVIRGASGAVSEPVLPPLEGWVLHSSEHSQRIAITSRGLSSQFTFTYILVPSTPGKQVIGPITVQCDGRPYQTAPIEVEVAPSRAQPPAPSAPQAPRAPQPGQPLQRGGLFLQAFVDTLRARVNEPIALTVEFYQAAELSGSPQYTPPAFEGFIEDEAARGQRRYLQPIDGVPYQVTELRTILRPATPGRHTIGPARLVVPGMPAAGPQQPYSIFEGLNPHRPLTLSTEPITIEVLPAGADAAMGGI